MSHHDGGTLLYMICVRRIICKQLHLFTGYRSVTGVGTQRHCGHHHREGARSCQCGCWSCHARRPRSISHLNHSAPPISASSLKCNHIAILHTVFWLFFINTMFLAYYSVLLLSRHPPKSVQNCDMVTLQRKSRGRGPHCSCAAEPRSPHRRTRT
jgi:hypothetical protein